jgi:hypothetical protein
MSDIIEGVSVISVGEAKGHGLFVDAQTLREVKACAETYAGGVKVNLDHGAGIRDIVGFCDNFRIIADKLVADLNLLQNALLEPLRQVSHLLRDFKVLAVFLRINNCQWVSQRLLTTTSQPQPLTFLQRRSLLKKNVLLGSLRLKMRRLKR